jgi:hypothetical protein
MWEHSQERKSGMKSLREGGPDTFTAPFGKAREW